MNVKKELKKKIGRGFDKGFSGVITMADIISDSIEDLCKEFKIEYSKEPPDDIKDFMSRYIGLPYSPFMDMFLKKSKKGKDDIITKEDFNKFINILTKKFDLNFERVEYRNFECLVFSPNKIPKIKYYIYTNLGYNINFGYNAHNSLQDILLDMECDSMEQDGISKVGDVHRIEYKCGLLYPQEIFVRWDWNAPFIRCRCDNKSDKCNYMFSPLCENAKQLIRQLGLDNIKYTHVIIISPKKQ